jgi:signal transduction histidine kinase
LYRASNVASSYDGTGLGLVGVRHTVEQHGGSISVASCEGEGSTFTIRMPLVSAA